MNSIFKCSWLFLFWILVVSCNNEIVLHEDYASASSQTRLICNEEMLNSLPNDPLAIAEIASKQMIHNNNIQAFNIANDGKSVRTPFPPNFSNILATLGKIEPFALSLDRTPENRLIGACISESYFLAGLLRFKNIPVRVRAGYFKNINENSDHIIDFWEQVARYRGYNQELLEEDPLAWKVNQNSYNQSQLDADHHIEHWICEYWNNEKKQWILLDANKDFLKLSSQIEVGYELPKKYFEYAHEAWLAMRSNKDYNPEMHEEYPQDGRSHIRSQLLVDFYNLLNHDLSCYSDIDLSSRQFVKEKTYEELSEEEILELDDLAHFLLNNPPIGELIKFYNESKTLKIESVKMDEFSFIASNNKQN